MEDEFFLGSGGLLLFLFIIVGVIKQCCNEPPSRLHHRNRRRRHTRNEILESITIENQTISIDEINELNISNFSSFNIENIAPLINYKGPEVECCICLDDIIQNNNVRILPCMHKYHDKCIERWLEFKISCPLCKNNPI